nr:MAG TPA: Protein of unknown function (DUF1642) [Caudoviricetes sp.]
MNIQELIKKIEDLPSHNARCRPWIDKGIVLNLVEQLDEPEPLKLKDIISRMKQLFPLSRSEWIDEILHEFGGDYGSMKYREGYEQGKVEGMVEREKVTIPQFVADWIKVAKPVYSLSGAMIYGSPGVNKWLENEDNQRIFAQAWFDGYEKEKWYRISMPKARNHKNHAQILCEKDGKIFWCGEWYPFKTKFTRKELEDADFGWVFDCPGIEVEEVK